ncbi:MAG: PLP-dependent cysteine synthase family protein [Thermomicrobiales bacterium]|nr:PLP-dependent cysteine synthase family protein [Thermomicrobiales bacterium]
MGRAWAVEAIRKIERDFQRSADTHLIRVELPATPDVHLYLKDESTHPTGSLKHRLARSLFLYGLCNGWIGEGTTVIEASSGSTAVSEAYFARLLGLPFIAVMPRGTSAAKVDQIAFFGGRSHFVDDPAEVYAEAERLAHECGGHYMDQFTYAERATDWRGNNNIAESIFQQMAGEEHPIPRWVVVGAGTGGTSATIGRYIRYQQHATELCVVDPDNSVFYDYFRTGDPSLTTDCGSGIEGIGRPRVEPSFVAEVVDRMIHVPNAASIGAARFLARVLGRKYGASTGTNLYGALQLAHEMAARHEAGSVVTLACDPGNRYLDSYFCDEWLARSGYDTAPYEAPLTAFYERGEWVPRASGPASDAAN